MAQRHTEEEVCPLCGDFVSHLNELTGWCDPCSPVSSSGRWLEQNADALEHYMIQGLSMTAAKKRVYEDNRPLCLSCSKPIKGGKSNQHFFCTVYVECRKAQRRYRTLRERWQRNGQSYAEARSYALEQIVREIGERTDAGNKQEAA